MSIKIKYIDWGGNANYAGEEICVRTPPPPPPKPIGRTLMSYKDKIEIMIESKSKKPLWIESDLVPPITRTF